MALVPQAGELRHPVKLQAAATGFAAGGYTSVADAYARIEYFAPRQLVDGEQITDAQGQVRIAIWYRDDVAAWRYVWQPTGAGVGRRYIVNGHRDPDGERVALILDCTEIDVGAAEGAAA